jgi:hypothetical protein
MLTRHLWYMLNVFDASLNIALVAYCIMAALFTYKIFKSSLNSAIVLHIDWKSKMALCLHSKIITS